MNDRKRKKPIEIGRIIEINEFVVVDVKKSKKRNLLLLLILLFSANIIIFTLVSHANWNCAMRDRQTETEREKNKEHEIKN